MNDKFFTLLVQKLKLFNEESYFELKELCQMEYISISEEKKEISFLFHHWPSELLMQQIIAFYQWYLQNSFLKHKLSLNIKFETALFSDLEEKFKQYAVINDFSVNHAWFYGKDFFTQTKAIIYFNNNEEYLWLTENHDYLLCLAGLLTNKLIKQIDYLAIPKKQKELEQFFIFEKEKKEPLFWGQTQTVYSICLSNYLKQYFCEIDSSLQITEKFWNSLELNQWVKVGFQNKKNNNKNKNSYFDQIITYIEIIPLPSEYEITDNAVRKIFPLITHTKFSTLDGVLSFSELVAHAKKLKHDVIGIADYTSAHVFPEVARLAIEHNIKPLYGIEFTLIDNELNAVIQLEEKDELLATTEYCFFDIETTGLYPMFDDIIEIAIVKYCNNVFVEKFQFLISTKKKLSTKIIDLTGITNELLVDKPMIKDVLKQFLKFINNSVLVAHNAIRFDIPFIQAKLLENDLPPLKNNVIDTLLLAQDIFPEYKSHNLEYLSSKLNVEYNKLTAHRAEVDAITLSEVFFKLIQEKQKNTPFKLLSELKSLIQIKNLNKRQFGNNIIIYAKNQTGLFNLYYLLSYAQINFFFRKPSLHSKIIAEYAKDLIVVNAPMNSDLINTVLLNNQTLFNKLAKKYDYLILPPPLLFLHDINRENFNMLEVQKILRTFYTWAKKLGKKIIANSMVKYPSPAYEEQYAVLVNAKGIAGSVHHLFDFNSSNEILPNFSYLNTGQLIKEYEFLNLIPIDAEELFFNNQDKLIADIDKNIVIIPENLSPPIIENSDKLLIEKTKEKLQQIYGKKPNQELMKRVQFELNSIIDNNYCVIYWVSYLLVQNSINNGYVVGSRGSVGSSFIAFLLNITEVNPLKPHYYCDQCYYFEFVPNYLDSGFDLPIKECQNCHKQLISDGHNIPFETFMGFKGNKVPDIDLNFSGEYQIKAHNFLRDLFGAEYCYRAGTVSTIASKTAYAFVKKYLEKINYDTANNGKLKWLIKGCIDVKRTTGQHPGGILVVPNNKKIYNFTPINFPADDLQSDWKTTHLAFNDLHDALLKFDILGHDDPTMLKILEKLTNFPAKKIPFQDPKILQMFNDCSIFNITPEMIMNETTGAIALPEFGTSFVRKILKDCQPKSFADLIRISGISHGTNIWKNNVETLVKKEKKALNECISCRDDIMNYLIEQNVESNIAFEIMESVRKGNHIPTKYINLLREHNIPDWYIQATNLIKYIFPKAHATAYVIMAWKVAFYKLYYPLEFYATYFGIKAENFNYELFIKNDSKLIIKEYKNIKSKLNSKSVAIKNSVKNKEKNLLTIYETAIEMFQRGCKFAATQIHKSSAYEFICLKEKKELLIPFISIDSLGSVIAEQIVQSRLEKGDFISKEDFQQRIKLNNTLLKKMNEMKILDELHDQNQLSLFDI